MVTVAMALHAEVAAVGRVVQEAAVPDRGHGNRVPGSL